MSGVAYNRTSASNLLHTNGWKFQDHRTKQLNLYNQGSSINLRSKEKTASCLPDSKIHVLCALGS